MCSKVKFIAKLVISCLTWSKNLSLYEETLALEKASLSIALYRHSEINELVDLLFLHIRSALAEVLDGMC